MFYNPTACMQTIVPPFVATRIPTTLSVAQKIHYYIDEIYTITVRYRTYCLHPMEDPRRNKCILYTTGRRELEAAVVVVRSRVVFTFRPLSLALAAVESLMALSALVEECILGACVLLWPMADWMLVSPGPPSRLKCLMTESLLEELDPVRECLEDVGDDGV